MRKGTKIVLFIGIGILAAAVIVGVLSFALNGFSLRRIISNRAKEAADIRAEELQMSKDITEDFANIEIGTVFDDVILERSSDDFCHLKYTESPYHLYKISVEGGTLKIKQDDDVAEWDWKNLKDILKNLKEELGKAVSSGFVRHDLVISLPKESYERITAATVSGDIDVCGKFLLGELEMATVSGDMKIEQMTASGTIALATTSGKIKVDGTRSGKMLIAATSGEIRIEKTILTDGEIVSVSGDVAFEEFEAETMKIKTTSGSVTGNICSAKEFHAASASGDIRVPDGGIGIWKVETISGDINLVVK